VGSLLQCFILLGLGTLFTAETVISAFYQANKWQGVAIQPNLVRDVLYVTHSKFISQLLKHNKFIVEKANKE
jgi:hypothetical protein